MGEGGIDVHSNKELTVADTTRLSELEVVIDRNIHSKITILFK